MGAMQELINKAEVLVEALPYIRNFAGKTFVIKYGGHAMVNDDLKNQVMTDVILMKYIGINPIVVHGGGGEISRFLKKMGKKTQFAGGFRITDAETMEVVEMVLVGKVNKEIVSLVNRNGGKAVGLCGKDADLFVAKRRPPVKVNFPQGGEKEVNLGMVGEIIAVNPDPVNSLSRQGYIPVIAPVGADPDGNTLNINADDAAGALAAAVGAEKLILLTDVQGIMTDMEDPDTLITSLSRQEAGRLIAAGKINGGMIPKVEACFRALEGGAARAHIIDGCTPHSILLEIFTRQGIGTMVTG